jgi:hypothetical protein
MVDTNWQFVEGAGTTIAFLQVMFHSFGEGGQELVDTVLSFITDPQLIPSHQTASGEIRRSGTSTVVQAGRAYRDEADERNRNRRAHANFRQEPVSGATITARSTGKSDE